MGFYILYFFLPSKEVEININQYIYTFTLLRITLFNCSIFSRKDHILKMILSNLFIKSNHTLLNKFNANVNLIKQTIEKQIL